MKALDVIRVVISETNTPTTSIGPALGKNKTYINTAFAKGRTPRCDTLAKILGVCGYALYAVPKDAEMPDLALLVE